MGDKLASGLARTMLHRPSSEFTVMVSTQDLLYPRSFPSSCMRKSPGTRPHMVTKAVSFTDLCRKLSAHDSWSQLAVHVALDMVVVIEDISKTPHNMLVT